MPATKDSAYCDATTLAARIVELLDASGAHPCVCAGAALRAAVAIGCGVAELPAAAMRAALEGALRRPGLQIVPVPQSEEVN